MSNSLEDLLLLGSRSFHDTLYSLRKLTPVSTHQSSSIPEAFGNLYLSLDSNALHRRLSWDGLSLAHLNHCIDKLAANCSDSPPWLTWTADLFKSSKYTSTDGSLCKRLESKHSSVPFVHVFIPLVVHSYSLLQERLHSSCMCVTSTSALQGLADELIRRLAWISEQALWDFFYETRPPSAALSFHIKSIADGSSTDGREFYRHFCDKIISSDYVELFARVPVLSKHIRLAIESWIKNSVVLIHRIYDSRALIQSEFGIKADWKLTEISSGCGDYHNGGQTVSVIKFSDGTASQKLVYKPKDLTIEFAFNHFVAQINKLSTVGRLGTLKVLVRDNYGFCEYIDHIPLCEPLRAELFYEKAGMLLAVVYLLGGSDCHHENMIAHKEDLFLIDPETLLEPMTEQYPNESDINHSRIFDIMSESVLSTGMLPRWKIKRIAGKVFSSDFSSLGIQPPPLSVKRPGWIDVNTDGMMPGYSEQVSETPTSIPVKSGESELLSSHIESLCKGFREQIQCFIDNKEYVHSCLVKLKGATRRWVPRNTSLYSSIQRLLLKSESLVSAYAQGLCLERLALAYAQSTTTPKQWSLLKLEINQMESLDIPFFSQSVDSTEVYANTYHENFCSVHIKSGLDCALNRLDRLDDATLKFQEKLIRGSVFARHIRSRFAPSSQPVCRPSDSQETTIRSRKDVDESLFCRGLRINQEIWQSALVESDGSPEWLGINSSEDISICQYGLVNQSLYSGKAGLALLFGYYSQVLEKQGDSNAAKLWLDRASSCWISYESFILNSSKKQISEHFKSLPYGLSGIGGYIASLQLLAGLDVKRAKVILSAILDSLNLDWFSGTNRLDIIDGLAGLIGPLLSCHDPRAHSLAIACGKSLVHRQLESGGWNASYSPLTGFSHGAAGNAAALSRLYYYTHDEMFASSVRKAVDYERSVYNEQKQNWPDFRFSSSADAYMFSWCSGAPGIVLSRIVMLENGITAPEIEDDLAKGVGSIRHYVENLETRNIVSTQLCCGVLGIASIIKRIPVAFLPPSESLSLVSKIEDVFIDGVENNDGRYSFGYAGSEVVDLPGLLNGLSGISLALLSKKTGDSLIYQILTAFLGRQ